MSQVGTTVCGVVRKVNGIEPCIFEPFMEPEKSFIGARLVEPISYQAVNGVPIHIYAQEHPCPAASYPAQEPTPIPRSLRSWVRSEQRNTTDPNYSCEERYGSAVHCNGVILPAAQTSRVWQDCGPILQTEAGKIIVGGRPRTRLKCIPQVLKVSRKGPPTFRQSAEIQREIDEGLGDTICLINSYDNCPESNSSEPLTKELGAYWEARLAEEYRWCYLDEKDKALAARKKAIAEVMNLIASQRVALTAATEAKEPTAGLVKDLWYNEIWKTILEGKEGKLMFQPPPPHCAPEIVYVKRIPSKYEHGREFEKEFEEREIAEEKFGYINSLWGDDEGSDAGFGTDGISYNGMRQTTNHADLNAERHLLQHQFNPEDLSRTKHEPVVRTHRDFPLSAWRYTTKITNTLPSDLLIGGVKEKPNTLVWGFRRIEERMHRAQQDMSAFNQILGRMTDKDVHGTICPGGWFCIVVLNERPELKSLAPFGIEHREAAEAAFLERWRETEANAVKQAQKIAKAERLGKRARANLISAARERIEHAYSAVKDFYHQCPCETHFPMLSTPPPTEYGQSGVQPSSFLL